MAYFGRRGQCYVFRENDSNSNIWPAGLCICWFVVLDTFRIFTKMPKSRVSSKTRDSWSYKTTGVYIHVMVPLLGVTLVGICTENDPFPCTITELI